MLAMIDILALWVLRLVASVQSRRGRALIENGTTLNWVDVAHFRDSLPIDENVKMMRFGFGRQDEWITVLGSEKRREPANIYANVLGQGNPTRLGGCA